MANNSTNKKSEKDVPLGMIETARSKVKRIKSACVRRDPVCDSKEKLNKPKIDPTHEQIAERAKLIWQNRGCIPGEDERNWKEAENQLRAEFGID